MPQMRRGEPNRQANKITARIIPIILFGLEAYGSYVFTKLVCIDYLLNPPAYLSRSPQVAIAVVVLTLYYLLWLIAAICFFRLYLTIIYQPGLVPRGARWYAENAGKDGQTSEKAVSSRKRRREENNLRSSFDTDSGRSGEHSRRYDAKVEGGQQYCIEEFWKREAFACSWDGRPPWCSSCLQFKIDRSHHCSELDRCVLRMDHFCPWVGGIVSETSFKFFVQFTGWSALYCLHAMIVIAYYFAQRRREDGFLDANWIIALIFAALFGLFSGGMAGSSLQFILINTSTIENLSRKTKVWYVAIHISDELARQIDESPTNQLRLISYPRPAEETYPAPNATTQTIPTHPPTSTATTDNNPEPHRSETTSSISETSPNPVRRRHFVILETQPGENPYDQGYWRNYKEFMGDNIIDWLFPIKQSPLANHDLQEGFYKMGPLLEEMKRDAGLPFTEPRRVRRYHPRTPRQKRAKVRKELSPEKRRRHRKHHQDRDQDRERDLDVRNGGDEKDTKHKRRRKHRSKRREKSGKNNDRREKRSDKSEHQRHDVQQDAEIGVSEGPRVQNEQEIYTDGNAPSDLSGPDSASPEIRRDENGRS